MPSCHWIGRTFCITLSATTKKAPPVLVNHISAPNVVIASAIVASAAVPGLIPPVRLLVKDRNGCIREQGARKDELYWDGSIEQVTKFQHDVPVALVLYSHRFLFASSGQDIPTAGLAEMLNCQFFVAAQCNPHIVPFFYNSKGDVGRPSRWSSGKREDSWRGGFLLSALELYLKSDMRAKFHFLNDVEVAVREANGLCAMTALVVDPPTALTFLIATGRVHIYSNDPGVWRHDDDCAASVPHRLSQGKKFVLAFPHRLDMSIG